MAGLPAPHPAHAGRARTTTGRRGRRRSGHRQDDRRAAPGRAPGGPAVPAGTVKPVLLTTFNKNLAADLRTRLLALGGRGSGVAGRHRQRRPVGAAGWSPRRTRPAAAQRVIDDTRVASCGRDCSSSRATTGGTRSSCRTSGPRSSSDRPSPHGRSTSGPAARAADEDLTRMRARTTFGSSPSRFTTRLADRQGHVDLAPGRPAGRPPRNGPHRAQGRGWRAETSGGFSGRATGTSSWTRRRTSARPTGRCCAPWSRPAPTTCSSPATPTSGSTTTR